MRLSDLEKYEKITIQCHDNPDADALASGYGLYCYYKSKGKEVRLVYSGRNKIQKSNLCLMVEKLHIPVEYIPVGFGETVQVDGLLITVDCQYGSGNVTGLVAREIAVIDHHQLDRAAPPQSEIQSKLGSCATLVWMLLKEESFDIATDVNLGTALYYGLFTDTNQFTELHNPLDRDMREGVEVDRNLINMFRNSNLSLKELEVAGVALIRYSFNDDYEFAVIKSQPCDPNILGLISDFLLQVDVIKSCVVFNEIDGGYKFSVRSCVKEVNASELAAFLAEGIGSGGGHREKAGGFISLNKYEEKYPTLHTEGFFNNRMTQYFDSYEVIYSGEYQIDVSGMKQYMQQRVPTGYVKLDGVVPENEFVTIRTQTEDINFQVEDDQYVLIASGGKIKLVSEEEFKKLYEPMTDDTNVYEYIEMPEYVPVIKSRRLGMEWPLTVYAKGCIPVTTRQVYAKPLEKLTKVFTLQDKNVYQSGKAGDYLVVSCENLHDIRIVKQDDFQKNYEAILDR